jgi:iron complex transport system substrate-binding protein
MASGNGTAASAMLGLAGATTAIQSYEGYRAISAEAALLAAPDWLVAPSHSVEARGGPAAFLAQPQLALLPAARAGRLAWMDSLYLLGFGPRTAHAARDLAALLHAAALPALPARPWLGEGA